MLPATRAAYRFARRHSLENMRMTTPFSGLLVSLDIGLRQPDSLVESRLDGGADMGACGVDDVAAPGIVAGMGHGARFADVKECRHGMQAVDTGIRVNAVCPNEVNTPMLRTGFIKRGFDPDTAVAELGKTVPLGRIAEPGDIAEVVVFLASDAARYMCGSLVEVNGGKPAGWRGLKARSPWSRTEEAGSAWRLPGASGTRGRFDREHAGSGRIPPADRQDPSGRAHGQAGRGREPRGMAGLIRVVVRDGTGWSGNPPLCAGIPNRRCKRAFTEGDAPPRGLDFANRAV